MDFNDLSIPDLDLKQEGFFRDVRDVEKAQVESLQAQARQLEAAIRMSEGLSSLASHGSFPHFVQAVKDMAEYEVARLIAAKNDREASVQAGKVQALRTVAQMLADQGKNRDALAERLRTVHDSLRQLMTRIPQEQNK